MYKFIENSLKYYGNFKKVLSRYIGQNICIVDWKEAGIETNNKNIMELTLGDFNKY
jgi:hypothetical protein